MTFRTLLPDNSNSSEMFNPDLCKTYRGVWRAKMENAVNIYCTNHYTKIIL